MVTKVTNYVIESLSSTKLSGNLPSSVRTGVENEWTFINAGLVATNSASYMTDTSGGSFSCTLPANPTFGNTICFMDAAGTFDVSPLRVLGNGEKIQRIIQDVDIDIKDKL